MFTIDFQAAASSHAQLQQTLSVSPSHSLPLLAPSSHFLSFVAHDDSSNQQPRPAPTDTSRSPQPTRHQPVRLARNCAVRSPRVPLSSAQSRSADAVAAPRSRLTLILMRSCYGFMIQMSDSDGSRVHENIQSNESNELRRRIISFNTMSDHKGETIGKQLKKCLLDWGIERVFTVTVDNASANKVSITYLTNKLKTWRDGALVLNGDFIHVRCCAHIMNVIVNEGLKKLDNNIISIRNAVKYVRSSTARLKAFQIRVAQEKILGKNGQPSRGSVVLDCPTRWNSTYTTLTTALKFRSAFDRMANEDKLYDAYFHEEEGGFLRIFYEATLSLSSSLRVTSSTCYNEICKVEKALNTMADILDPHISMIASSMKEKFEEYWEGSSKINKLLIVASILDPRGKMNFATLCFETLYGKDSAKCAEMKDVVKDVLNKLFEAYSAQHLKPSASASASAFPSESVSAFPSESAGVSANSGLTFMDEDYEVFEDPFSKYTEMVTITRDHIELSNELDLYFMESVEYQTPNALGAPFDILLWWKANSSKYPILSQIARDVLAIPVSTVASESAFSTGGRVLDEYRSSMTPDMVEALILTQNWFELHFLLIQRQTFKCWWRKTSLWILLQKV
ncbi:BED-type domain-containing protein [Citrus sinensis]|uniref:BED-type domain-containing protein n=1 Tax=Citrus sinensis TaxID=2711 RepID=A0ACB8IMG2_CITSI|nr:BED-type domain-containing protein [Citrus sinensis]